MGGRLDPAVAAVRVAVREESTDLPAGTSVLVACSGGADSTALASACLFEGRRTGWVIEAAIVDHQLQTDSAAVAERVADQLTARGFETVHVVRVTVGAAGGPEGAARAARYQALERLADASRSVVMLGHTRDDQAESVLLGLARGSGVRSLAGMGARRGVFRRPLLRVPRETTRRACAAEDLEVWDDPHNNDDRFARARLRQRVLPVLESELGPGVSEALARTAQQARDDADLLDALAEALAVDATVAPGVLDVAVLAAAPTTLRRRVLRKAAMDAGSPAGDLTFEHVVGIDRLLTDWHGQSGVDLPGFVRALRVNTPPHGPVLHVAAAVAGGPRNPSS